jgi:O-antigen/teichoic acid export membrane protein
MFEKLKQAFLKKLNIKETRTKNVMKGSFSMLLSSLIGNITRLGLVMILSRYYSKEEFGIWATITATAAVIAYGDFGIINALRNKLSQLIVLGEDGLQQAKKYFFSSFIFFIFLSLVLSLLVLLLSKIISFDLLFKTENQLLKKQGVLIILWVQFLFFLNIPFSMGGASFFSFQESKYSAFFSTTQALSSFAIVVILAILKFSIVAISIGYFVSGTITSMIGTLYFIKRRNWFSYTFKFKEFVFQIKELLSTGIKFMGLQLSSSFLQNTGTLLAGSFLGLSIAAEFNMVQKLYAFITGIYQSILNPIWGGYAEASAQNDWHWCKKTLSISLMVSAIVFSCAIIILYFFGNYFLLFFAGKGYITKQILFLFLGLTYLFFILFSFATILQNATNRINFLLGSLLTASVLIFPISKIFMKEWNIIGVAVATSLIWMVLACLLTIQSYYIINKNLKLQIIK